MQLFLSGPASEICSQALKPQILNLKKWNFNVTAALDPDSLTYPSIKESEAFSPESQ